MAILIPDMEMPKACFRGVEEHCPWFYKCRQLRDFCDKNCNEDIISNIYQERLEDCPLVELPPHGELVQRSDILRLFDENKLSAREAVMKAPTILEAST